MSSITAEHLERGLDAIIEEVDTLSADYEVVVRDAIEAAREKPFSDAEARRLYIRILTILRTSGRHLDEAQSASVAGEIKAEAEALVSARASSEGGPGRRRALRRARLSRAERAEAAPRCADPDLQRAVDRSLRGLR